MKYCVILACDRICLIQAIEFLQVTASQDTDEQRFLADLVKLLRTDRVDDILSFIEVCGQLVVCTCTCMYTAPHTLHMHSNFFPKHTFPHKCMKSGSKLKHVYETTCTFSPYFS